MVSLDYEFHSQVSDHTNIRQTSSDSPLGHHSIQPLTTSHVKLTDQVLSEPGHTDTSESKHSSTAPASACTQKDNENRARSSSCKA